MCGLAGFLGGEKYKENDSNLLHRMSDALFLRGPDGSGLWCDSHSRIGLAHRRLAIVDLSPAGCQPMMSASDRYVIAFNGEIYNHLDIRKELEKTPTLSVLGSLENKKGWRGHSDTETLLAAIETWGLEAALKKTIGMFAIALWDRQTHILTLARDRFGEKPLYFGWQGNGDGRVFLFGSELKALKAHTAFSANIDRNSLCLFLRHNYIPAPYSIYHGISKLEPGCLLSVSLTQPEPKISRYWDTVAASCAGINSPFGGSPDQAVNELEILAKDAVRQQMMADVPLGAFLSGGVDSSTVVALMQAQSTRPVKTFTIGFDEESYNEAVHAKAVAAYLGTEHTELYVTSEQAMAVIPRLSALYDEPFSDSSQIPTFLVSQLARKHVTVSLSGDGGDELFCGYNRYQMTQSLWRKLSFVPISLRKLAAMGLTSISPQRWNQITQWSSTNWGDKLHKGAGVLSSSSVDALYLGLVSHWDDPAAVVIDGHEHFTQLTSNIIELKDLDDVQRMMVLDMLTYLPDDILVKVDRAAMGVSLEARVPFLDHRVAEFAWRLPQSMKLRDGQTKWVLRQVLYRYIPKELIERPKMGFGVPLHDWLRGPLRDWAESLLDEGRLRQEGFFHPEPIRKKWEEHLSGKRNWAYHLWDILMFQAWLESNMA